MAVGSWSSSVASTAAPVSVPRIRIVGDGPAQTTLISKLSGSSTIPNAIFYFKAPSTFATTTQSITEFEFSEFSIVRTTAPSGADTQYLYGIQLAGLTYTDTHFLQNIIIENVYVLSMHVPIGLSYASGVNIEGVRIQTGVIGIQLADCGNTTISDALISNGVSDAKQAILVQGNNGNTADMLSRNVAIDGAIINIWNIGLQITDQSWGTCANSSFSTNAGGSLVAAKSSGSQSNWSFSACTFLAATTTGIAAVWLDQSTSFFQFTGCYIVNSYYGVLLGSGTAPGATQQNRIIVNGNQFTGNIKADVALNGAAYCNIGGNGLVSSGGTPAAYPAFELAGIYTSGAQGNNYIVGNSTAGPFSASANSATRAANYPYA